MKKLLWLILVCYGCETWCETSSEALQTKLNALRTMSADFKQVVKAKHREISRSSGTMALSRPGRFRWQTENPMPQIVVADGRRLWVYDVDLEQVSVKKQEKSVGGTAGLFLSGYNDTVARDFDVKMNKNGKTVSFDLNATSNKANFQRVTLVFEGAALKQIALYDQLGQLTDVVLNQVRVNPTLASSLFKFHAPKGVDVVEQ
jgi:outer membrane lipoprotein carrier protein